MVIRATIISTAAAAMIIYTGMKAPTSCPAVLATITFTGMRMPIVWTAALAMMFLMVVPATIS